MPEVTAGRSGEDNAGGSTRDQERLRKYQRPVKGSTRGQEGETPETSERKYQGPNSSAGNQLK